VKKVLVALLALVAIASVAGNLFLYQRYSTSRPVMRIGSDTVTIKEYRDALEYHHGQTVLTKLAMNKLVLSEAKKAGVTPSEKDVDTRIADIERRQPKQLEEARKNPAKMTDLRQELMRQIATENLAIKNIKMTDAEVRAFYNQNKAVFAVPTQARTVIVIAQNAVDAATAKALLAKPGLSPNTIATNHGRLGVVGVNYNPDWNTVSPAERKRLSDAVLSTPERGIKTVQMGGGYAVVRVDKRADAGIPKFEQIKPQVERFAKITKASKSGSANTLAKLYDDADIEFEIPRYASYFQELDAQAKKAIEMASAKGK
jgi:foldase protein PrsA